MERRQNTLVADLLTDETPARRPPCDPDELAVELARRRNDQARRLAAATVKRLARTRHLSTTELQQAS